MGKWRGGNAIDRSRPVTFRIDGRQIDGFAGDTVLSALLADGIDTLGEHDGNPIGLTPRSAPAVTYASLADDHQRAMPMSRMPAIDGAELVTVHNGRRPGPVGRLFQPGRTLGLPLDRLKSLPQPWLDTPGVLEAAGDVVVVGGGVAGLSAALTAARAGLKVTLVEASPDLGGNSGLFGTQEGEDGPEESMARLSAQARSNEAISVFTHATAFALRSGLVRAHVIDTAEDGARGRVVDLVAKHIVLATGAIERLPIIAGNRLPGVVGAVDAFELARRYGVWSGSNAMIATTANQAYRLAMLAQDAGVTVDRIFDSRPDPASRFIAFTRAYGIRQATGTVPEYVQRGRHGRLEIFLPGLTDPASTERLIFGGSFQPDLTLWHAAGGSSEWNAGRHALLPVSSLEDIVLAGAAAGYQTRRGCIASGADAIDQLLGRQRQPVEDPIIDAMHETPADAPFVAAERVEGPIAYLDDGAELLPRPVTPRFSWRDMLRRAAPVPPLSQASKALGIGEVAAGVTLGIIPPDAAGVVAQERVALVALAATGVEEHDDPDMPPIRPDDVPAYLFARYGEDAVVVAVQPDEAQRLLPGALIQLSSDTSDPMMAVGVVLRSDAEVSIALMSRASAGPQKAVSIRDHGRSVAARIVELRRN